MQAWDVYFCLFCSFPGYRVLLVSTTRATGVLAVFRAALRVVCST